MEREVQQNPAVAAPEPAPLRIDIKNTLAWQEMMRRWHHVTLPLASHLSLSL